MLRINVPLVELKSYRTTVNTTAERTTPCRAISEYTPLGKPSTESEKRVIPKHPLPHLEVQADGKSLMPALLKAYLRMGCKVCGEAHWDKAFNVADVVVLLAREDINQRYLKHFMRAA